MKNVHRKVAKHAKRKAMGSLGLAILAPLR